MRRPGTRESEETSSHLQPREPKTVAARGPIAQTHRRYLPQKEDPMSRPFAVASFLGLAACLAASVAGPAHAERLGKDRSLVLVGIDGHQGEFVYPGFGGYIGSGEIGGEIAYYRF